MGELIFFEYKKITRRRMTKVMVIASFFLTIFTFCSLAMQESGFDTEGTEFRGLSGISLEKEQIEPYRGELTEKKVKKAISAYQKMYNNPDNVTTVDIGKVDFNGKAYWEFFQPNWSVYFLITKVYSELGVFDTSDIAKIDLKNDPGFYGKRIEKIEELLNMDYGDSNYSEKDKAFWLDKSTSDSTPYHFDYFQGWRKMLDSTMIWMFNILVICICTAPVFANEYQTGADSVVLTTKYGKTKIIRAKIAAAILFATVVFAVNIALSFLVVLIFYGTAGWNSPIQIFLPMIPYHLTFLQACLLWTAIAYIIMMSLLILTLFLSANMKSPLPVLIIIMLVIGAPAFFGTNKINGLFSHILALTPIKALDPLTSMQSFLSYGFGNTILSLNSVIIILYILLFLLPLLFIGKGFKNHQVTA